jgi:hypothetical protein
LLAGKQPISTKEKELNMMNSNVENNPNRNTGHPPQEPNDMDWRERREMWRQQRREARYRDPLHGLFFGLLLILMGGLFLAVQMGQLPTHSWWQYLLVGMGAIFIIDGLVHYLRPAQHYFIYGKFVAGAILLLVGGLFLLGYSNWWPVVLIAAGCAVLLRLFLRRV